MCKSAVSFRSAVSRPDVEHNTSITVQSATYCHFFVVTLFCVIFVCVAVVHLNQIETDCLFVARSLHFAVKANDNRTEQEE